MGSPLSDRQKRPKLRVLARALLLLVLLGVSGQLSLADTFDTLRLRWRELLVGSTDCDTNDVNLQFALLPLGRDTNYFHTNFWSNLPAANNSAEMTLAYNRICSMAMAYGACGSRLKGNPALAMETTSALDWMYANRYNESMSKSGNWWDWEAGSPMALNDSCVLLYDALTPAQLNNYMNAINKFVPVPNREAANLIWQSRVVAVRGVLVKDGRKLELVRDALGQVFRYVANGDGFYTDGSFIQHGTHPYTGGYGASLLHNMAMLLPWLNALPNQTWNIVDAQQTNVINWVYDSYQPLLYRGAMMDMVRGREISRAASAEHDIGRDVMLSILRLAQWTNSARMKSMVKAWALADTSGYFLNTAPVASIPSIKQLLWDTNIVPREELVGHYQFPHMDRIVNLRPGWAFGLAMSSSRIANYESLNNENLHGWFTGDGMTCLYNADASQFSDSFWPTVDPYRLPGITVEKQLLSDGANESYLSDANWVGGAMLGVYGAAGMQLHPASSSLSARKSWFMFENEIVCLGAGLNSSKSRNIETIVENRRLSGSGNNRLTLNGAIKPAWLGWSETIWLGANSWAHLQGNVAGADVGYYFPQGMTLNALRETRTGAFYDINTKSGSTNRVARNYLTLWLEHGPNLSNANYAYVLLPVQSVSQVSNYAANPNIVILTNCPRAQGVRQSALGITAVNFWEDGPCMVGGLTASQKCSVVIRNDGTFLEVGISDPTQINATRLVLEIDAAATDLNLTTLDAGVSVEQNAPKIRLSVNVNQAGGRSFHARFFVGMPGHLPPIISLTNPGEGARLASPALIMLSAAQASGGPLTNLTYFNGARTLGQQTAPPYKLLLSNLFAGEYKFAAVAADSAGLIATSTPVTVSVYNAPKANPGHLALPKTPFTDVDLWAFANDPGTPASNLLFTAGPASSGQVGLLSNGHVARLTPASNYVSSSLFPYAVTDMGRDSRMLLYYRFHPSDLALDGTVADASGNGRDGLLLSLGGGIFAFANTAPFPLFNQTSLQLVQSGSNSAARLTRDITDVGLSDRSWTFGCWFLRATTNDEDFLFYVGDGNGHGGSGDELEIYGSTDQAVWLAHYNILGLPDARLASGKLSNQWHHVALTFERTNNCSGWLRFYVDGIIISRPLDITWALNQGQPLVVGGHSSTNSNLSRYFNGWLDDAVLLDGALGGDEILRLASRTAAHFGGTTASNIVTVTLNAAPWLSPILDRSTHGCVPLIITNVAVDPDIPPQALTYSLSRNPPPPLGAAIDSGSGVFTWRPTLFQVETTNKISVVVTDSGNPSLSATQSFKVTVNPVTPACITALGWSNGLLQLVIVGQTGPDYTVQGSSDLTTWRTLLTTNSPSLPLLWRDVEAANYRWRFYRVLPGP